MNTIDRREDIVRRLTISAEPISASSLAAAYGVSRQIIVGDIALQIGRASCRERV